MAVEVVFETHSMTVDNERGRATGWLPGELSEEGRRLAHRLGQRRRDDHLAAVFCSDLARAAQTAAVAFGDSPVPVLLDWRLRECDYGQRNGMPVAELHAGRAAHLDDPYPGGESWRQAIARVGRFLTDLPLGWDGRRVLVIGHVATRWGLDHYLGGVRWNSSRARTSGGRKAGSTGPASRPLVHGAGWRTAGGELAGGQAAAQ